MRASLTRITLIVVLALTSTASADECQRAVELRSNATIAIPRNPVFVFELASGISPNDAGIVLQELGDGGASVEILLDREIMWGSEQVGIWLWLRPKQFLPANNLYCLRWSDEVQCFSTSINVDTEIDLTLLRQKDPGWVAPRREG